MSTLKPFTCPKPNPRAAHKPSSLQDVRLSEGSTVYLETQASPFTSVCPRCPKAVQEPVITDSTSALCVLHLSLQSPVHPALSHRMAGALDCCWNCQMAQPPWGLLAFPQHERAVPIRPRDATCRQILTKVFRTGGHSKPYTTVHSSSSHSSQKVETTQMSIRG